MKDSIKCAFKQVKPSYELEKINESLIKLWHAQIKTGANKKFKVTGLKIMVKNMGIQVDF